MAKITSWPLKIVRGVLFEFAFRYKDGGGSTIDLTGQPLIFAFRSQSGLAPLFEITLGAGANANGSTFVVQDPATTTYLVTLTDTETAAIKIDDGFWWLRWDVDDAPHEDRLVMAGPLRVRNPGK